MCFFFFLELYTSPFFLLLFFCCCFSFLHIAPPRGHLSPPPLFLKKKIEKRTGVVMYVCMYVFPITTTYTFFSWSKGCFFFKHVKFSFFFSLFFFIYPGTPSLCSYICLNTPFFFFFLITLIDWFWNQIYMYVFTTTPNHWQLEPLPPPAIYTMRPRLPNTQVQLLCVPLRNPQLNLHPNDTNLTTSL